MSRPLRPAFPRAFYHVTARGNAREPNWEMTWSFAGPDGRATFEWITIDGEQAVRWRRVGGHEILNDPAR